ncbi:unnamed protein product [Lota lota]
METSASMQAGCVLTSYSESQWEHHRVPHRRLLTLVLHQTIWWMDWVWLVTGHTKVVNPGGRFTLSGNRSQEVPSQQSRQACPALSSLQTLLVRPPPAF